LLTGIARKEEFEEAFGIPLSVVVNKVVKAVVDAGIMVKVKIVWELPKVVVVLVRLKARGKFGFQERVGWAFAALETVTVILVGQETFKLLVTFTIKGGTRRQE
jgi:hypothetical protein